MRTGDSTGGGRRREASRPPLAAGRRRGEAEPTLFDLPLDPSAEPEPPEPEEESHEQASARPGRRAGAAVAVRESEGESLSLFEDDDASRPAAERVVSERPASPRVVPSPRLGGGPGGAPGEQWSDRAGDRAGDRISRGSQPSEARHAGARRAEAPAATLSRRLGAAFGDLLVHAGILTGIVAGIHLLGVRPGAGAWPPVLLFLAVFSFLYTVVPLAFWGQTPGMACVGLVARRPDGSSLSFDQTALRWLGAVATLALAGVPLLPLLIAPGGRSFADRISGSVTLQPVVAARPLLAGLGPTSM